MSSIIRMRMSLFSDSVLFGVMVAQGAGCGSNRMLGSVQKYKYYFEKKPKAWHRFDWGK